MDEKIKIDSNMNQDIKSALSYINNNDGLIENIDLDSEFREGADPTGAEAFKELDRENVEELDTTVSTIENSIVEDDISIDVDDLF